METCLREFFNTISLYQSLRREFCLSIQPPPQITPRNTASRSASDTRPNTAPPFSLATDCTLSTLTSEGFCRPWASVGASRILNKGAGRNSPATREFCD